MCSEAIPLDDPIIYSTRLDCIKLEQKANLYRGFTLMAALCPAGAVAIAEGRMIPEGPLNRHKPRMDERASMASPLGAAISINGGLFSSVDISKSPYSFTAQHYSHSKEFRSNIIDEKSFWESVLLQ